MDPYSSEGELINMHNAFHQGQYQEVIDFDVSDLSPENEKPARILTLRARLALGQHMAVLDELKGTDDVALQAVASLALNQAGQTDKALSLAERLVESAPEDTTVQTLVGTVLQAAGRSDEALALLGGHQGSLEAVALIVQIHLAQNRNDLALKEVAAARRWAQDSLLVNLAESWVGIRIGGERYQQAFYVYEELAQAPSTSSVRSLVSQAVAELHLGRLEEAQAALEEALTKEPQYAEAIANLLVLNAVASKDVSELATKLKQTHSDHAFLTELEEKSALFDQAATKYSAKVSA
ncbi:hypothetical protein Cpir12675_004466 [Ceratocystis pirilliformis]|uniref:Coatomer subunit epsilon n=1 Tax=Ceratocystis pirilliformis TaxID=259994 RepID=A0ABR3YWE3_9PEZI